MADQCSKWFWAAFDWAIDTLVAAWAWATEKEPPNKRWGGTD